jgi:hypothetical protein
MSFLPISLQVDSHSHPAANISMHKEWSWGKGINNWRPYSFCQTQRALVLSFLVIPSHVPRFHGWTWTMPPGSVEISGRCGLSYTASCTLHTSPSSGPRRHCQSSPFLQNGPELRPTLLPSNAWQSVFSMALSSHNHVGNWHEIHSPGYWINNCSNSSET